MKSSLFGDAFTKKQGEVEETGLLRTYNGYTSLISCFMGGNIKGIKPIMYMHNIKLQTQISPSPRNECAYT